MEEENYDFDQLVERIIHMLSSGYDYLYQTGKLKGYWEDLRGTALAGVALDYKELPNSLWIKMIRRHLENSRIVTGESNGSWNEEIWDTSMCIIALKSFEVSSRDPIVKDAIDWISSLYNLNNRNNWHDEPWETSWALIAILTAGIIPETLQIDDPVKWLIDFQEEDGRIIAPHYTAYFLLIYGLLNKTPLRNESVKLFDSAKDKSLNYLNKIALDSKSILWSGEAWANGQILWAIADTSPKLYQDVVYIEKIVSWFEENQSEDGNWSDIEDTSSSLIGLYRLLKNLNDNGIYKTNRGLKEVMQRRLPSPRVYVKRPFFERHPETGGLSIHLNNRIIKGLALIGAMGAGLATILTLIDYIRKFFQ